MNVALYINIAVEYSAIIVALSYLLNIKLNWQKGLYLILFIILPSILFFFLVSQWIMIPVLLVSLGIFFYLLSKKHRVWMDITIVCIGGVLANYLAKFILYFFSQGNNFIYELLYICSFLLIFIAYIYLYKQLIQKINEILMLSTTSKFFIFLILFLTALAFYLNIYFAEHMNSTSTLNMNLMIQLLYFIIVIIVLGVFLYSIHNTYRAKRKVLETEQFMQYMTALEEVNRDMQKFRHDYTNILLTIQGYLDQKDMEGLQSYFQQSIVQTGRQTLVKHQTLGRLDNLESVELKGLLATKILQADALNIPAIIEIPRPVPMLQMSIVDIARVMGILMDNALEAVKELTEGNIRVAIFPTDNEMVQLLIENSYGDMSPNIGKLFQQGYSTKGQGRGSGLTIAKAIIGSYPNAMMHTRVEDGKFIQELSIY